MAEYGPRWCYSGKSREWLKHWGRHWHDLFGGVRCTGRNVNPCLLVQSHEGLCSSDRCRKRQSDRHYECVLPKGHVGGHHSDICFESAWGYWQEVLDVEFSQRVSDERLRKYQETGIPELHGPIESRLHKMRREEREACEFNRNAARGGPPWQGRWPGIGCKDK